MIAALGLVVLVGWSLAVPLGLGRAVLGADPEPHALALLFLPGVALAAALFLVAAWPRLVAQAGRWRPGLVVTGLERSGEGRRARRPRPVDRATEDHAAAMTFGPPVEVAAPLPPPLARAAPERPLVHLGPSADPAWAAWCLRWSAPGHGTGTVVLPSGPRVLVGRDPSADVVIRLDQVSWQHVELDVREGEVQLLDLESTNGTRLDGALVPPRRPARWAPRTAVELASPVAVTLTLEPLR